MLNTRWQPVAELNRLRSELERAFAQTGPGRTAASASVFPPLNLWESDDNLYVEAELPGFEMDELEIYVTGGNQLSITGERKPPKLEGGAWLAETVHLLSERGIPVCGHLGLTPQSVNKLGGYRVQGRDEDAAAEMLADARLLESAGIDMLVLECVPTALASDISKTLSIPVIGIGAGPETDAQVLVIYDMLGLSPRHPKFSKNFLAETGSVLEALEAYASAVRSNSFPQPEHSFK